MQMFWTNPNPKQCAMDLDDKRLNKMIIETCQIMSTAIWKVNCDVAETLYSEGKIYLPTHENHQIVVWSGGSFRNYLTCTVYLFELLVEYRYRFNKLHSCIEKYRNLQNYIYLFSGTMETKPLNCTTNHKHIKDTYLAYQKELCYKWSTTDKKAPVWTKRKVPVFYQKFLDRTQKQ